jgi:hypothetical protein
MEAMIEALQGIVLTEPEAEVQPDPTQSDDATIETQLSEEVRSLVAVEPEPEVQPDPTQPGDVAIETKLNDEIRTPAQADDAAVETELTEEMKAAHPEWEPAREASDSATETQLAAEISELWSQHTKLSGTRRMTAKELRLLRAKLGERLHAMKQLLCRVGRGGQWRGYLRAQHIPRTTADRLCERYAETLTAETENVPTGAINEPEDTVEQLAQSLLPRLKRILPDTQSVFRFVAAIAVAFNLISETTEDCILVSQPKERGENSPSTTGAPEAASPEMSLPGPEDSSEGIAVPACVAETNGGGE